jgi:hypothetical protein
LAEHLEDDATDVPAEGADGLVVSLALGACAMASIKRSTLFWWVRHPAAAKRGLGGREQAKEGRT